MSDVKYKITKEQCEASISGVCPGCGCLITAIETVDNGGNPTFWSACEECARYTGGCLLEDHLLARLLVEEGTLVPYKIDKGTTEDEKRYWLTEQTYGAVSVVRRIRTLLEEGSTFKRLSDAAKVWRDEFIRLGHYKPGEAKTWDTFRSDRWPPEVDLMAAAEELD